MSVENQKPWQEEEQKSEVITIEPALFKVIMHNDDFTTMDFVVDVLMRIFNMNAALAYKTMLEIHNKGQAVCGIFTFDIARTKIEQVHQEARSCGFPLLCTLEEV